MLNVLRRFGSQAGQTAGRGEIMSGVVRRRVSVRGHPHHVTNQLFNEDDVERLVVAVDRAAEKAHLQVVNQPMFTALAGQFASNRTVATWIQRVRAEASNPQGAQLAAPFGYAIEVLATHLLGPSVEGWKLTAQVAEGRTRPDLVASKGDRTVWLDFTAEGSAWHVYDQKNWHLPQVCAHPHAEVTYPSLNAGTLKVILANAKKEIDGQPNPTDIDAAALLLQTQQAQQRANENMERWRKAHRPSLAAEVKPVDHYEQRNPTDAERQSRNDLFRWLNKTFAPNDPFELESLPPRAARRPRVHTHRDSPYQRVVGKSFSREPVETDQDYEQREQAENTQMEQRRRKYRLAASILMALKIDPANYGLHSVTGSTASGVIFLERYSPAVPPDVAGTTGQ